MQDRAFANDKIEFLWNHVVVDLVGDTKLDGAVVRDVNTGEEQTLPCRGLFVAIGHRPNTDLFKGVLDMEDTGYLITQRRLHGDQRRRACSPAATCRTTPTARPSPRPGRAAWPPSTPSAGSRRRATPDAARSGIADRSGAVVERALPLAPRTRKDLSHGRRHRHPHRPHVRRDDRLVGASPSSSTSGPSGAGRAR